MENFFELYEGLLRAVPEKKIEGLYSGERWTLCETAEGLGLAMTTEGDSVPPMFPQGMAELSTFDAAKAVKSWNFKEAGFGLAAINGARST